MQGVATACAKRISFAATLKKLSIPIISSAVTDSRNPFEKISEVQKLSSGTAFIRYFGI